jgi:hypothetical protein
MSTSLSAYRIFHHIVRTHLCNIVSRGHCCIAFLQKWLRVTLLQQWPWLPLYLLLLLLPFWRHHRDMAWRTPFQACTVSITIIIIITRDCRWFQALACTILTSIASQVPRITQISQPWARRRSRSTSGPRNNFGWTASPSSKRIIYIVFKRSK